MNVQKGFTLIELLVVISIIILFSGLSFAAYNNFNEEKKLEDEAKKLINVLNLTSKKASSAEISGTCGSFKGFLTRLNTSTETYSLRQCCDTNNCSANSTEVQSFALPINYDLSVNPAGNTSIQYLPLSRGTTLNQATTIVIKNTKINKCVDVTITTGGLVSEGNKYQC